MAPNRRFAVFGVGLVAAGLIVLALSASLGSRSGSMTGVPARSGSNPGGMMSFGTPAVGSASDPGSPGFIAGTSSSPRIVHLLASGLLRFSPEVVTVRIGETIDFEVTSMGMASHEFMVGPAADVAADAEGTPEVADIGMMQTKSLTYTFTGSGPFAFACHAAGHYEAGMKGTIVVVS